jgi:5-bromo-4-chloroindolyl phosphate hydrolysis protein
MDKNEWYRVGEEIRDQVQSAIDSGNFSQLGRNIGESVNRAVDDMSSSINRAVDDMSSSINHAFGGSNPYDKQLKESEIIYTENGQEIIDNKTAKDKGYTDRNAYYKQNSTLYRKPNLRPDTRFFDRTPKGTFSGIVYIILGSITAGISGLFLIGTLGAAMIGLKLGVAGLTTLGIETAILAAGIGISSVGTSQRGRVKRYRQYVEVVKEKLYCSIEELAAKTGKGEKYIRKDLKKMMNLGMFKQGHLDSKETCLIASDEVYEQYKKSQESYEEQRRAKLQEESNNAGKTEQAVDDGVRQVIEEGQNYIRMIRKCNDEIPGEEMSDKLDHLELLVTRIFDQVEKEPELAPELRKMLSYYLPTTQKLLEVYRDLDRQQIESGNIAKTKKEIESAVDTINEAFEKFLDDLFRDTAWDIQSDISVLNTMLKQDGYLKKDFEKETN